MLSIVTSININNTIFGDLDDFFLFPVKFENYRKSPFNI